MGGWETSLTSVFLSPIGSSLQTGDATQNQPHAAADTFPALKEQEILLCLVPSCCFTCLSGTVVMDRTTGLRRVASCC